FFDIDWDPPALALRDKVLLPVLGRQFGQEVDEGKLPLHREGGALWVAYYERRFPASPRSYAIVLEHVVANIGLLRTDPRVQDLESILATLRHLPAASTTDPLERLERSREKEVLKRRLAVLCADNEE